MARRKAPGAAMHNNGVNARLRRSMSRNAERLMPDGAMTGCVLPSRPTIQTCRCLLRERRNSA
jgi:hypothetical protein